MTRYDTFIQQLDTLKSAGQFRTFPEIQHSGKFIYADDKKMLNLSSNDYLGLASDTALQQAFFHQFADFPPPLTSSSSRLLTGNFPIYTDLETLMATRFQREACLLFNSGYHANIGILPTLSDQHTLILADKLVHASMIDGILLSQAKTGKKGEATFMRYRHNDYAHLATLLQKYATQFKRIIIVTESVFSMDGDIADLAQLVAFKQQYDNVLLYVDEAHAIGVYGEQGLGMAEVFGCIAQIDFLVGTFGKALASMGAYVICDQVMKSYLINQARSLIFSTALPPINVAWSYFLTEKLPHLQPKRQYLQQISERLRQAVATISAVPMLSESCIIPYVIGDNQQTVNKAQQLQQQGYYCLPIRPPTVPMGTSRLRFSLTAEISAVELEQFIACLSA